MSCASILAAICALAGLGAAAGTRAADACAWAPLRATGVLAAARLREASGLAASRRRSDLLWALNDGGNAPLLYALDTSGGDLGSVRVDDARITDWEDLASFELDGSAYLLIADTGDNGARRTRYQLYAVEEPQPGVTTRVAPAWRIVFVYPDGARDCEAVAVDGAGERVLLLSKRDSPPRLYSLPLRPAEGRQPVRAQFLGRLPARSAGARGIQSDRLWRALYEQPTSWDLAPSGVAVLTYRRVEVYARDPQEPLLAALARPPATLELPGIAQAEALAFAGADTLYVTGEGHAAPLLSAACACTGCTGP
jgi:hypothetical protein